MCASLRGDVVKMFSILGNELYEFTSDDSFSAAPTYTTEYSFSPTNDPAENRIKRGACLVIGDQTFIAHNSLHMLTASTVDEYTLPAPFATPDVSVEFDLMAYVAED